MGEFLAGYLEKVPPAYRTDVFSLVKDGFRWFLDVLIMPPWECPPATAEEKEEKEEKDATRERYKNVEIPKIIAIAEKFLRSADIDEK